MIIDMTEILTPELIKVLTITLFFYVLVLVCIFADLISGIRKAKKRGEARTSKGIRMTVEKTISYYLFLIVFTVLDIVSVICCVHSLIGVPIAPYFTGLGTIIVAIIEVISIFENADKKTKKKIDQVSDIVTNVIKDEKIIGVIKDTIIEKIKKEAEE
jgi:hypothetical protein